MKTDFRQTVNLSTAELQFRKIQKFKLRQGGPPTPRKNNEKFCNFANFVHDKALNSQFAILFIGERPLCVLQNVNFM